MFRPGDGVLVACSGGPDSVCLALALLRLRRLFGIEMELFHFDHRLRPGSAADAAYVRRLADRLGLPFHLRVAEDGPAAGVSVEAWAARARGEAAERVRREVGAGTLAEGHTLDDQAETVLLNLIRGGGLEAIGGIWPGGEPDAERPIVQPLIDVERTEVEAFCRALRLRPRRDATNEDRRYLRNAIRLDVIPAIERSTGRGVRRPIARSAELLREDRIELDAAAALAGSMAVSEHAGELRLDAAALRSLPRPIASRVVRAALYRVMTPEDAAPGTRDAVAAILDLAAGRPGRRRDLPNGSTALRERGYVSISRHSPEGRV